MKKLLSMLLVVMLLCVGCRCHGDLSLGLSRR